MKKVKKVKKKKKMIRVREGMLRDRGDVMSLLGIEE